MQGSSHLDGKLGLHTLLPPADNPQQPSGHRSRRKSKRKSHSMAQATSTVSPMGSSAADDVRTATRLLRDDGDAGPTILQASCCNAWTRSRRGRTGRAGEWVVLQALACARLPCHKSQRAGMSQAGCSQLGYPLRQMHACMHGTVAPVLRGNGYPYFKLSSSTGHGPSYPSISGRITFT